MLVLFVGFPTDLVIPFSTDALWLRRSSPVLLFDVFVSWASFKSLSTVSTSVSSRTASSEVLSELRRSLLASWKKSENKDNYKYKTCSTPSMKSLCSPISQVYLFQKGTYRLFVTYHRDSSYKYISMSMHTATGYRMCYITSGRNRYHMFSCVIQICCSSTHTHKSATHYPTFHHSIPYVTSSESVS